jgi:hypothetical protein
MVLGSKRLRRFIADMDLDVVSLDESTSTSQMVADAAAVRRSTDYVIRGFRLSPTTRA